jgi:hypothetical protein
MPGKRRVPPQSCGLAMGTYTAFFDLVLGAAAAALRLLHDATPIKASRRPAKLKEIDDVSLQCRHPEPAARGAGGFHPDGGAPRQRRGDLGGGCGRSVQAIRTTDATAIARASEEFLRKYQSSTHAPEMVRSEILPTTLRLEPR